MRIAYTEGNVVVFRIEDTNHVGIITNVRKKKNQVLGYDIRSERGGAYTLVQVDKEKSKYSINSELTAVFIQNTDNPTKLYIDKSLGHLFTQLEPGANRSVRRVYKGITGTFTQFGQQLDAKTEIGALLAGVRVEEAKPLNSMPFIITSYGKDKQNLRAEFGRNIFRVDATPEQRLAAFKEYVLDSFDAQKVFYQVLKDMETMGVSSRKLEEILENRLRNKSEVEQLIDGEFKIPGFNEKTFEDQIDRLRIEDPIQAAKIASEVRQAIRAMNRLRRRLRRVDLDDNREEIDGKINEILFPTISRFRGDEPTSGIATIQSAELPAPIQIGTPINASLVNQTVGGNLLGNDILRQIELAKLEGRR